MNLGRDELKRKLEAIDDELLISRNKALYKVDSKSRTKLKTIMGEVEIERRIYVFDNGIEKKYVYLLDEYLELFKYGNGSKYSDTVLEILEYKSAKEGKSTREISKFFDTNQVQMSQQTVWDIMKKNESITDEKEGIYL